MIASLKKIKNYKKKLGNIYALELVNLTTKDTKNNSAESANHNYNTT